MKKSPDQTVSVSSFTRSAQEPVVPAESNKYDVEIAPTSNVFKRDHRICVEITSLDVPTGVAGDSAVE
jgi:predicted acyl esterase